ncbi:MAG: helix-turn-helix domain-containing protein [Clostridia bacterium]|nr:helix-turn-helix domain-containing protein [Clostridia bacterium]MBO7177864.1 helix-turn-helix domain-containing protein [Clostridia bacterium]
MQKKIEIGLLNDYYGGLLTDYQTKLLSLYYDEDLSLKEISEEMGVSRQAVADVIKRSSEKLLEFESKLGLVEKISNLIDQIEQVIVSVDTETADKLKSILNEVKEI